MKVLILLTFILPKDILPPTADLLTSLQTYHLAQTNAQLSEYQATTKGEWLKYVPSIGMTYTVNGHPRPSASINTGLIYTARKDKQGRAAKRKSIELSNQLAFQQEQRKLLQLIANYEQEVRGLVFLTSIQEISNQIYAIKQSEFENLKLDSETWLKIQKAHLQEQYLLAEKRKGLMVLEAEVLGVARYGINTIKLNTIDSSTLLK